MPYRIIFVYLFVIFYSSVFFFGLDASREGGRDIVQGMGGLSRPLEPNPTWVSTGRETEEEEEEVVVVVVVMVVVVKR